MVDSLLPCIFCGAPTGDDRMIDDNGAIACGACGQAEFTAQYNERVEARLKKLANLGFGDAAEFARNTDKT